MKREQMNEYVGKLVVDFYKKNCKLNDLTLLDNK